MEKDVVFNGFVNYSLSELDDPERFWRCWRLNDCGTCLNRGDGCGWCPYVCEESSTHCKIPFIKIFLSLAIAWNICLYILDFTTPLHLNS